MCDDDLERVVDIASVCYPDHPEDMAIFKERLRLFPRGCLALAGGGSASGYLLSYPWTADSAPPLNALVLRLPETPEAYYLHDLALMPARRGQGHARAGIEFLRNELAGGLPLTLVSVNGTVPFWERHGFRVRRTPALDAKLASYGRDARFMVAGQH
ncbi:MAG: GNAT family N-acetyltransferase [Caulobacteraceae bacterium]|nr:GNAT family N-acetyltransferase [Caulobacteraceae bacterium]